MRTLYIYYVDVPEFSAFDYESIINDLLDEYLEGGATFGYTDSECSSYGEDVSLGMVDITEDADVDEVMDMIQEEFMADGIEVVDITVG